MTPPDDIRDAVTAGDFPRAARAFEERVRVASVRLRAGEEGRAALEETRAVLDWCRLMALAWRNHVADRLRSLEAQAYVAREYRKGPAGPDRA